MSVDVSGVVIELPVRGSYRIVPTRSTARFRVGGLFGLAVARGQIPIRSGSVDIVDGRVTVTAELNPAGITTGIRRRDLHLCSAEFLDVDRFPELRFDGEPSDDIGAVRGWVTVHGDTVSTTLEIREVCRHDNRVDVVATVRLDRLRFGVTAMRGLIGRYVDVELRVTLLQVS